jgi:putative CocE/NonD family hydrolase
MPEIDVQHDVQIPMRDGVLLNATVVRPVGVTAPALLTRRPYPDAPGGPADQAVGIAQHGYAVVVQHSRGRYGSQGRFYPHRDDPQDGYDTVEWIAAQDWCTGRVGMYGVSYGGWTQWAASMCRPPHLAAIAPAAAAWGYFGSHAWYHRPGVLSLGFALQWTAGITVHEAERQGIAHPIAGFAEAENEAYEYLFSDPDAFVQARRKENRLLAPWFESLPRDNADLARLAPWFRDWCEHPDPDDRYWTQMSASGLGKLPDIPVLQMTGWYDYAPAAAFEAMSDATGFAPGDLDQRIIVGPWAHAGVIPRKDVPAEPPPWADFGADAPLGQFFARHLKDSPAAVVPEAPIRLFVMGDNVWRDEHEWPLERTAWTPFFLGSGGQAGESVDDGVLLPAVPLVDQSDRYRHDPQDPVPDRPANGSPLTSTDSLDQTPFELRRDVLTFTSAPLEADLEVTGPVRAAVWFSSSAPSADVVVNLVQVFADGYAVRICRGIARRHDLGGDSTPLLVDVDLGVTSTVFGRGHRLRIDISSSEYPTYDLNRGDTGPEVGDSAASWQTVLHGPTRPSLVILPVIPR